jgi:signal peptidase I
MEHTAPKTINYLGPSMEPTLKPGDRLQIIPYRAEKIRRGDVIVFILPGGVTKVIHRVVSMDSQGIRTRGDNSTHVDPWTLSPNDILGRVVTVERGKRRLRIIGGVIGQLFSMSFRAVHRIDSTLSSLLRPGYRRLATNGTFRSWLPDQMKPRVISFHRPGGTELQLLMGRRVIGRWLPGKSGWTIRRPFRLLVDEGSLPENPAKQSVVSGQLSVADEDL